MKSRYWISGPVTGVAAGVLAAGAMTYRDWSLNPGGIFSTAGGTNWSVVLETAWSWFLPVAVLGAVSATALLYWISRQSRSPGS